MKYRKPRGENAGQTVDQTLEQQPKPEMPTLDASADPVAFAPTLAVGASANTFSQTEQQGDASPLETNEGLEIPPSLYARFEAFEFLGRGGMGAVFKARDIKLSRDVAVKLLFGADPQLGGSLLREAKAQARIVHENVCELYEAGTADQVRFIVMQLIRGEPLDKAKTGMTLEEKVRVIRQIASALHEAHRLGIVHRDVKPANIMVERGDNGAWKPYIMDFGLAREMGDSGATVSGTLMGTPSFMSPEQASGKIRSLDRRTDIYSLGASLYDIIVGRPPLVADGLAPLLQAIILDEPLSPRQIDREVPLDLDAIVMRCIAKHPASRYDSANALGDDLQRFLDGEPVLALRRARLYAIWRRAKRHKVKLTIATIAIVVTSIFVGGWWEAKQKSEKQATLARELGESVKEMEYFLRIAQALPLHDIGRERKIVRDRLKDVESLMQAAGDIGLGPGNYALARGHLALQDFEKSLEHARRASAAGYQGTGLDYTLGVSLSEIYKKELADTKRMEGERKKQRIAAIETEYKQPALVHLKAALGKGALEAPSFAEGLIAFYEGRLDDALANAREAFDKAPWLYEAKKLEGDALFAMGKPYGHDAAFDFDKMSKWYGEADVAYRVAVETGSSDPTIHVALCELKTQTMNGVFEHGSSVKTLFDEVKATCGNAITANPEDEHGHLQRAEAYVSYVWSVRGTELENAVAEAAPVVQEVVKRSPESAVAHYLEASLWRTQAQAADNAKRPAIPAIDAAIQGYGEALRIDPKFAWARNELCATLMIRGRGEARRAVDPLPTWKEATAHCEQVLREEPNFLLPWLELLAIHQSTGEYLLTLGQSPEASIRAGRDAVESLRKLTPTNVRLVLSSSRFAILEAAYAIDAHLDPEPALAQLEAIAKEGEGKAPAKTINWIRAEKAFLDAYRLSSRALDPSVEVAAAKEFIRPFIETQPNILSFRLKSVDTDIIGMQWALHEGKLDPRRIDPAFEILAPALSQNFSEPALYVDVATLHELSAAVQLEHGEDPRETIEKGLEAAGKALAIHARWAGAFRVQGQLLRLRAKQSKDEQKKSGDAKQAVAALEKAVELNPLFERTIRKELDEMRGMAGKTPGAK